MTEKLYDLDSLCFTFSAQLLSCRETPDGWALLLDRTAFFPEGGGQSADTGTIGPARVRDVQLREGEILHYADRPLEPGRYACALDAEQRLRRMQNHSGEHVVSGLIHSLFGFENVGFHMGESCMTMDYSGELSWEQLMQVEQRANEAVRRDLPIRAWYPDAAELAALPYRSKKALSEAVRLVEIPGIVRCACCAPHVASTGRIGVIKLLTAERHRGGVRITCLCGMDALEDYRRRQDSAAAVSQLLSVPRDDIAAAVERLLAEQEERKQRFVELSERCIALRAESAAPGPTGNICVFEQTLSETALRELVNRLVPRCDGVAAVFWGSDADGYRYILGSRRVDLRAQSRAVNAALRGRGGGSSAMIQGRAALDAGAIRRYWDTTAF